MCPNNQKTFVDLFFCQIFIWNKVYAKLFSYLCQKEFLEQKIQLEDIPKLYVFFIFLKTSTQLFTFNYKLNVGTICIINVQWKYCCL